MKLLIVKTLHKGILQVLKYGLEIFKNILNGLNFKVNWIQPSGNSFNKFVVVLVLPMLQSESVIEI
jgi:hypothetical protein